MREDRTGAPRHLPRLTSAEAFGFGVGWEWVDLEAETVRQLVVFLEDRRALYQSHHREVSSHVIDSVLQIRANLTAALQQLSPKSGAANAMRAMRSACAHFLDETSQADWGYDSGFVLALGELRGVFAVYLGALVDHYGITVHGELERMLRAGAPVDDGDV